MQTSLIDLIGYFAGTLTTVAFIPQVIKTWKAKSAKDLSLNMFLIFCTGIALWLAYGIMISSWPIIIPNFCTFILALTLLFFKFWFKK